MQLRSVFQLLAANTTVSGADLAVRLGITRTAVWKQIEQLRAMGVVIHAQAGSGYRLEHPIEFLESDRILAELSPVDRGRLKNLHLHWQIDSTNSELLRRANQEKSDLAACFTEIQTSGRGRHGRTWQMPLGSGLTFSLLKRFDVGMSGLGGLSLAAGVSVVRALNDCGVGNVKLKWPNDVIVDSCKLAGILIELGGDALGPCYAVIGIGLNIHLPRKQVTIDQSWTDLATLARGMPPSRNQLAGRLLTRLIEVLDIFAVQGFSTLAEDYAHFDALRGQLIQVSVQGVERRGIAQGVDAHGALLVRDSAQLFTVDSGEAKLCRSVK